MGTNQKKTSTTFPLFCVATLKSKAGLLIATGWKLGYFKSAPGTLGSLASLLIWAPCVLWGLSPWLRFCLVLIVFLIGWWATFQALPQFKSQDPKEIIIDEVAGQGLALVLCPASWPALWIGFVLFRLFDIFKPWPISFIDRQMKSALGVMLDDMLAGFFVILLIGVLCS